jgi:hypothetical protein
VVLVGLVGDRDLHGAGADLRRRDGDLVVLDHAGERHAHGRAGLVLKVVFAATGEQRGGDRQPGTRSNPWHHGKGT